MHYRPAFAIHPIFNSYRHTARSIKLPQVRERDRGELLLDVLRQVAEGLDVSAAVGLVAAAGEGPAGVVDAGGVIPGEFFVGGDIAQGVQSG